MGGICSGDVRGAACTIVRLCRHGAGRDTASAQAHVDHEGSAWQRRGVDRSGATGFDVRYDVNVFSEEQSQSTVILSPVGAKDLPRFLSLDSPFTDLVRKYLDDEQ